MTFLRASKSQNLTGTVTVPGDKSISHRSIMLGSMAIGRTTVKGLLEGEDVLSTAAAFRAMGATIEKHEDGTWTVDGVGIGGLQEPDDVLDMGNSGTSARLILGILAGHDITCFLTGDDSLRKRPMGRVINPLSEMGATFESRAGGRLPLMVRGAADVLPITYELPMASAQVKSAVLLAGLSARGKTTVIENKPTRDHTERMLTHFGGEITVEPIEGGGNKITVTGQPELTAADLVVPSDPSSAAFPAVAAAITPGSEVVLPAIGMNPTRSGIFQTLKDMGADLTLSNERIEGGEPVADITIRHAQLTGIEVPEERAPSMIDEYPVLAVAAAQASGKTVMRGIGELRVKESDRLAVVAEGLRANGITVEEGEDWMIVHGTGGKIPGGGTVTTHLDHRISMSFLVMGLVSEKPVTIDDGQPIETSFPNFLELMTGLGADIAPL
ncbi:3-phosphoshikimate 1-carboxyvinyltransferase [Aestuariispira insulae]|uniref:3-phosphoshikimate 1-carboxyvinyltransferase n=1 Tax=Aestuariispira insulae TaxID=1461337 RepID=A0A3D9H9E6_9PROT|nr:3-phosphoshikimate 1-carboxyvinyltransferase [Aestuariispira insulae]RED46113.1 3-phosphoshikimate 1-carboxyvinyltransferase [Aestuariispira insulae]